MAEAYDIVLGGKGYMIAPKSYRRGMDSPGLLGSAPVRQVQREFAGSGRLGQAERDRFASSLNVLPVLPVGSGAVQAGPKETLFTVPTLPAGPRRYSVMAWKPCFVCAGGLYGIDKAGVGLNPNNLGAIALIGGGFAGDATGIAYDGRGKIYISRTGLGYIVWTNGGASFDTTATLQLTGCAWYAGSLWGGYNDGTLWRLVRATSGSAYQAPGWPLDGVPIAMRVMRDGLYVSTASSLWRVRGEVVSGAFVGTVEQVATNGGAYADDLGSLAEFNGSVYTWYNGEVCELRQSTLAPARFVPTGLRGASCKGLGAAGGYLWAAVGAHTGASSAALWAFDGRGWWCQGTNADGLHDFQDPFGSGGWFDDAALIVFGGGSLVYGRQLRPVFGQPGWTPGGELVASLWEGRDADADKLWTRVGAEIGLPPYAAHTACTVALDYSTTGQTWTQIATVAASSSSPQTLAADLPAGVRAKAIMLRWRYSGVTNGTPYLRALWAEYRPIEQVVPRRHWQFDVLVSDEQVRRSGGKESRKGKDILADLWGQWEAGGTLTLRDIDYDLAAVQRSVRIVGIEEMAERVDDRGRWGEAVCRVKLVEV